MTKCEDIVVKDAVVRINELLKDKDKFLEYSKGIEDTFGGPSSYFYLKVIDKIKECNGDKKRYNEILSDDHFIEVVYATLVSWGMHRMDKNTRMTDFENFRGSILKNRELLEKLYDRTLRETDIDDEVKQDLLTIFDHLEVMNRENAPKLVAHSKTMHFLLPNLVPPMDKGHVIFFFYGEWRCNEKNKPHQYIPSYYKKKEKEGEAFIKTLKCFQEIANRLDLNENDLKNKWDTTIPKIIDNAIIGYNNSEKEKFKNENCNNKHA